MKIGVIGTGNMGSILIHAFIESESVHAADLTMTNRTIEKAYRLKALYPDMTVASSAHEVARSSDIIFVCVKPIQFYPLLKDIRPVLSEEKIVISITSPITLDELESVVPCQVARVVPSVTNRSLSGCTLVTFGNRITESNQQRLWHLVKRFSEPVLIEEKNIRIASDIVSCGPAFFSYLIQRFIDGAINQTSITKEQATDLASQMFIGFGKLLEKKIYTLETLQDKVSVKGGVTGVGIEVLEHEVGDMFEQLIQSTHRKYDEDRKEIIEQFFSKS